MPDTNTFHEDIAWLADSGVTKGCNPPINTEFCPNDEVTREQMAAFMHRLAVNRVIDADTVDGQHGSAFLEADGKATDSDELDGKDSSAFALTSDFPSNGGAGCFSFGFYPESEGIDYSGFTPRTSTEPNTRNFHCPLQLPHNATITAFTASFDDQSGFNGACQLFRMDVTGGRLGGGTGVWAVVAVTEATNGDSGDQTVSASSIDPPVFNARRYAYSAACQVGDNGALGINGVVVQYDLP